MLTRTRSLLWALALTMALPASAFASHFRFGLITWQKTGPSTVQFTATSAWRSTSGVTSTTVIGDLGDGTTFQAGPVIATLSDLNGESYNVHRNVFSKTYGGPGPYTAELNSCCRISTLSNGNDTNYVIQTTVDLRGAQTGSSVSSITPLLQWPQGPNSIQLPVADPDGNAISCALSPQVNATTNAAGYATNPQAGGNALTVSHSCVLSWDASAAADKSKWAVQVQVTEGGLSTDLDFIVEVNGQLALNTAPVCTLNGNVNNTVGVGQPFAISVTGTDVDSTSLAMTAIGVPAGATVTPASGTTQNVPFNVTFAFTPTVTGAQAVTINFADSLNAQGSCNFSVNVVNAAPVANAGADQTVDEGVAVTLDGSASSDAFGRALAFSWRQVAGPPVALLADNTPSPTFDAPLVSANTVLTFELTVDNGSLTATDTVDVTVVDVNTPPVADAGDDASLREGASGHLDGTASYDADGDTLAFAWTQVSGPAVSLTGADTAAPTFTAPAGSATLVFELVVFDGAVVSAADTVQIAVTGNSAPIADPGPNQTVNENASVTLNGAGSSDPDADGLAFQWTQVGGPPVALDYDQTPTPAFTAPFVGAGGADLAFQLVVTDDFVANPLASPPATVTIHVANVNDPPSCDLAVPSLSRLWPPNHKMVRIAILGVSDQLDQTVRLRITGVTSDEPVDGPGDGHSSPDAVIVPGPPADTVLLRAERTGDGNGRVYRITFVADDGLEPCAGAVTVTVPHDRRGPAAIDDGQVYDATVPSSAGHKEDHDRGHSGEGGHGKDKDKKDKPAHDERPGNDHGKKNGDQKSGEKKDEKSKGRSRP